MNVRGFFNSSFNQNGRAPVRPPFCHTLGPAQRWGREAVRQRPVSTLAKDFNLAHHSHGHATRLVFHRLWKTDPFEFCDCDWRLRVATRRFGGLPAVGSSRPFLVSFMTPHIRLRAVDYDNNVAAHTCNSDELCNIFKGFPCLIVVLT